MFRCRERVAFWSVGDNNAFLCGRITVDVVHTDTGTTDVLHFVGRFDDTCSDLCSGSDNQCIVLADDLDEFILGQVRLFINITKSL